MRILKTLIVGFTSAFCRSTGSQDLQWKSFGGDFEIEEKNGVSWGARVGHSGSMHLQIFNCQDLIILLRRWILGFRVEFSGESSGFTDGFRRLKV